MRSARPGRGLAAGLAGVACAALLVGSLGCSTAAGPDPWEKVNRKTFAFNETADHWVIEPAAKAWDFVLPDFAETGIQNFFDNLRAPIFIANNLLQGEVEHGYLEVWRFILNSTVGVAGFVDVASKVGWPRYDEDFGLTLGHWGLPQGPYVVLPIFGASTVRDTVGLGVDATLGVYSYFVPIYVPIAARATELLNKRAIYLEEIAQDREEAFDFYVFVRNAYLQNREHRLLGPEGSPAEEEQEEASPKEEDLYYLDDEGDDQNGDQSSDQKSDQSSRKTNPPAGGTGDGGSSKQ